MEQPRPGPGEEKKKPKKGEWTKADKRKEARNTMFIGLGALVVGGLVTGISLSVARGGGTYYIATGALGIGAICFFYGLISYFIHSGKD